ncbi:unnamed protein product (macronuclear) [Paramecium tetraurelia]|uniref:Uncharacterized protein n=1 Tax=Paramecium tetraurelia TaxID=5888 RepID=A0DFV8_PARTE|nr:uncharacterized protein GSPATT00039487001 [Paramecium tetraurelia]CAK81925.1 unnamed protein product [Paramecium tetraurelia]|eukprot:XP_001449322.1 hypothetical protein (macronuclear) [Paramecium tetraurelia strain d4-2]
MAISNVLDLVDAILQLITSITDISRLDVNISIGMVCRIIFFIVVISMRDLRTYPVGEFIAQVVAWFVFHVYILYYEKQYFYTGKSDVYDREVNFKIMDTLQLIIATIYMAWTFNSMIEIVVLAFFIGNLVLNSFELIYIAGIRQSHPNNYIKQGGYTQMYFGFLFGAGGVIVFLIDVASKYSEDVKASAVLTAILYLTIIGQFIVVLFSFCYFCIDGEQFKLSYNWTKGILGFLYGANVGLFSIFYGFLTGLATLCYIIYMRARKIDEHNK